MTKRRDVLKAMAMAPLAALVWTREELDLALSHVPGPKSQVPAFFTADEWKTIRVLADDIIPKDARSGSATDAKVPEFMDFMLSQGSQNNRTNMRNGLAWLNQESQKRFTRAYGDAAPNQRTQILDDIAWPARATEAFRANATWFNSVRDLTAAGFFSSRTGYGDLGYTGGIAQPRWTGAPPAALAKLGVSYDEWDKKYGRGY